MWGMLFMVFSLSAWAGQGEELFQQAVGKYQSGDYEAAILLNEQLLNELGQESSAGYFNLGNSYFKSGKLGKAVLNYLRAQELSVRDADIKANLAFARQAVVQVEADSGVSRHTRWVEVFRSLSRGEFKWLAAAAIMLTGGVFLWSLYAGLPLKRVFLLTGISCVAAAYIGVAFIVCFVERIGRAVVLTNTEARFEPSQQATVYFKVSEGAEIKVIRQKDGWVKIQRADGRSGWVMDQDAERIWTN